MRTRTRVLAGLAALAASVGVVGVRPAVAGSTVTVNLSNIDPTRTVTVTDLQGNDLTSTGMDLGSNNGVSPDLSFPFRVTVTDSQMTPSPFDIEAQMTNLYDCGSTGCSLPSTAPTGDEVIASKDVSVSFATNPLGVSGVSGIVAPLFSLTGTITGTTCTTLATLNTNLAADCTGSGIPVSETVAGVGQSVTIPVTGLSTSALDGLPLVPQAGTGGAFTSAQFDAGVVPAGYGSTNASATSLPLVTGASNTTSGASALLGSLQSQLSVPTALPDNSIIPTTSIDAALRTAFGTVNTGTTQVGDEVWDVLDTTTQTTIISDLAASVIPMGAIGSCTTSMASCVVGVTGTYQSFPVLNVAPPAGTAGGNYEGTLVLTGF